MILAPPTSQAQLAHEGNARPVAERQETRQIDQRVCPQMDNFTSIRFFQELIFRSCWRKRSFSLQIVFGNVQKLNIQDFFRHSWSCSQDVRSHVFFKCQIIFSFFYLCVRFLKKIVQVMLECQIICFSFLFKCQIILLFFYSCARLLKKYHDPTVFGSHAQQQRRAHCIWRHTTEWHGGQTNFGL